MLRSVRVRLVLSFLLVIAVGIGIAEIIAERTASREFDSYLSRTDTVYLETLAQNLGDYYAVNGSWEDVQSVFSTLPGTPGFLQLQDSTGTTIADSSPGRGPGGPGQGGSGSGAGDGMGSSTPRPDGGGTGPQGGPGSGSPGPDGGSRPSDAGAGSSSGAGSQSSAAPDSQLLFAQAEGEGGILIAPAEQTPVPTEEASGGAASGREVVQRIPVLANGQQVATLVVMSGAGAATPASENSDRFLDRIRLALLVGGIGALLIALILGAVLVDGITRPLRRLRDAARRIAGGDFSQRVAVTSPLEAAELADSFNRMTETLERDRETRRRLLADIVHELRSPLSVIQGTSQGFLDGVIPADPEHAAVIRDEAALLSKLITDLRDLALAEAGELRLDRKPIDVAELVSQAVGVLLPRAREDGVEVEGAAEPGLPLCLVDRDRTLQIVGNLLDNALRHTKRGGRIAVRIRQVPEGMLSLDVADTGEGIAPDHLPYIFERFYRVDAARARGGGTGLGLAIVKQLAEAQGGGVAVESAPGRGSVFTLIFPIAEAVSIDEPSSQSTGAR